jgi:hypothetical protein
MTENLIHEQPTFQRKNEEKTADVITVKINPEERELLKKCKTILEQEKDSTCLKQLAWIGAKVIHDEKTAYILGTVFDNKRKNKRLGIITFES